MNRAPEGGPGTVHGPAWKRWAVRARNNIKRPDILGVPLIAVSGLFVAFLLASPFLAEKGSIDLGDEGSVGEIDHEEEISGIGDPLARMAYRFGDRYCHQKDHRSFELNGNQMPVCARDIGLFVGIFIGCIMGSMSRREIPWWGVAILLFPMLIDGGLQAVTSYESWNPLRLATGLLGGAGIGAYVNGTMTRTVRLLLFKAGKG